MPTRKKLIYGSLIMVVLVIVGIGLFMFTKPHAPAIQDFNYLTCNSDKDCTTTKFPINDCCLECDVFPINIQGLKLEEEWRKKNCEGEIVCPTFKCQWPTTKAVCLNSKCVLKEISTASQEEIFSISCPQDCSSETKSMILATAQKTLEVLQKEFPWMVEPSFKTSYTIEVNPPDTSAGGRSYVDYETRTVKLVKIDAPTVVHEISHLLTAEYFGIEKTRPPLSGNIFPKGPAWFQEGLGMYLEYKIDDAEKARYISLLKNTSNFLDITNSESSGDAHLWYAQAWSILDYIIQKGGKEHFKLLCECVKAKMLPVMGGVPWNECFDGIYKDITPNWDAFYQEWIEYVRQNY